MDVMSFDGDNYTINETTTTVLNSNSIISSSSITSVTFVVNKTGYVVGPASMQEFSSWFSKFELAFEKNETKAGETWQIPLDVLSTSIANATTVFNGNLTETFGDIQNITVPAGTYRVFSVDVSGANLTMTTSYASPINETIYQNSTINGLAYMVYGTCRLVEMNLQTNYSTSQNGQLSNASMSERVELVNDTEG
jgi:hypothetical protein